MMNLCLSVKIKVQRLKRIGLLMKKVILALLLFTVSVTASDFTSIQFNPMINKKQQAKDKKSDRADLNHLLSLAQQGDLEAQYKVGFMYYDRYNTPDDLDKALQFFRLAAEQGHIQAQYELATMLLYEKYTSSIQESIYWYTLAAEQGHIPAMSELAWIYQSGTFTPQSDEKAIYWYQALADEKVSAGQLNLGIMYLEGRFVQQDIEQALFWLNQAAQQKDPEAMLQLGFIYAKGVGIKPDPKKAFDFYKQSAQKGNIDAQFYLARMYSQGKDIEKNSILAYVWFKIAIKNYHSPAIAEWILIKETMTPEQIKKAENTVNIYLEDNPNLIWKLTPLY